MGMVYIFICRLDTQSLFRANRYLRTAFFGICEDLGSDYLN